jgi:hypothetical protein
MADAIRAGTILIEEGTLMPESLRLASEPDSSGWTSVKNLDRYELDRKINKAGWTFFYMAGKIKATVLGFDKQKTVRTALKRIITNVKSQKCNSLEITQVTSRSFLKVSSVSVSAHSRHIPKGLAFSSGSQVPFTLEIRTFGGGLAQKRFPSHARRAGPPHQDPGARFVAQHPRLATRPDGPL